MSNTPDMQEPTPLRAQLAALLNTHSCENGSDTPDFILSDYLAHSLAILDATIRRREQHYGRRAPEAPAPTELPAPSTARFNLFTHMSAEHGLTLLDSELYEIELVAAKPLHERIQKLEALLRRVIKIVPDSAMFAPEEDPHPPSFLSVEIEEALSL